MQAVPLPGLARHDTNVERILPIPKPSEPWDRAGNRIYLLCHHTPDLTLIGESPPDMPILMCLSGRCIKWARSN